jgi:hypothetical protein
MNVVLILALEPGWQSFGLVSPTAWRWGDSARVISLDHAVEPTLDDHGDGTERFI